ncbi:cystatin-11-like [Dendrobates tinctorius]|uniref:cystatin-11-like n=1 Tax=Dendrobates tinctorius TaxID=92724 RepID=UPI003CCA249C
MNSIILLLISFVSFGYCAPMEELIKAEVAPVLGGWNTLPLDSKKVMQMAKLLQNSYNKKNSSRYWSKITEVEEALMQVANWINYQFTVIIEPTGCLKEENLETCKTPGFEHMMVEKCHYFIRQNPSKFKLTIIGKTCEEV